MNDDLDIRILFDECQPQLTDNSEFMAELDKKLDAVEGIRAYHSSQVRRLKSLARLALVVGCVLGVLTAAVLILKPTSSPQVALLLDSKAYLFLMTYKMQIMIPIGLLFTAIGLWHILKPERPQAR